MGRARGFTLIEIMTTVAIVAVLASVAVPTYQDQVRKARRADGQSLALDIAQQEERFFTDNGTYTQMMSDLGYEGTAFWKYSDEEYYLALIWTPTGCDISNCYRILTFPMTYSQYEDGSLVLWSNGRQQRLVGGQWQEGWE